MRESRETQVTGDQSRSAASAHVGGRGSRRSPRQARVRSSQARGHATSRAASPPALEAIHCLRGTERRSSRISGLAPRPSRRPPPRERPSALRGAGRPRCAAVAPAAHVAHVVTDTRLAGATAGHRAQASDRTRPPCAVACRRARSSSPTAGATTRKPSPPTPTEPREGERDSPARHGMQSGTPRCPPPMARLGCGDQPPTP